MSRISLAAFGALLLFLLPTAAASVSSWRSKRYAPGRPPLASGRGTAVDEIGDILLKIGIQSGNTAYYDIRLVQRDGLQLHSGSSLPEKREAEWLVELMKARLGLEG